MSGSGESGIYTDPFGDSSLTAEEQTLAGLAMQGYALEDLRDRYPAATFDRSRLVAEAVIAQFALQDAKEGKIPDSVKDLREAAKEKIALLDDDDQKRVFTEISRAVWTRKYYKRQRED